MIKIKLEPSCVVYFLPKLNKNMDLFLKWKSPTVELVRAQAQAQRPGPEENFTVNEERPGPKSTQPVSLFGPDKG